MRSEIRNIGMQNMHIALHSHSAFHVYIHIYIHASCMFARVHPMTKKHPWYHRSSCQAPMFHVNYPLSVSFAERLMLGASSQMISMLQGASRLSLNACFGGFASVTYLASPSWIVLGVLACLVQPPLVTPQAL